MTQHYLSHFPSPPSFLLPACHFSFLLFQKLPWERKTPTCVILWKLRILTSSRSPTFSLVRQDWRVGRYCEVATFDKRLKRVCVVQLREILLRAFAKVPHPDFSRVVLVKPALFHTQSEPGNESRVKLFFLPTHTLTHTCSHTQTHVHAHRKIYSTRMWWRAWRGTSLKPCLGAKWEAGAKPSSADPQNIRGGKT